MQCAKFLDGLDAEQVPFYDTAGSVAYVAAQKSSEIAAIGRRRRSISLWS